MTMFTYSSWSCASVTANCIAVLAASAAASAAATYSSSSADTGHSVRTLAALYAATGFRQRSTTTSAAARPSVVVLLPARIGAILSHVSAARHVQSRAVTVGCTRTVHDEWTARSGLPPHFVRHRRVHGAIGEQLWNGG